MVAGRTGLPHWLVLPLIEAGGLCAALFAGAAILSAMKAPPQRSSWRDLDRSVRLEWAAPAIVPMLVLTAVAAWQSRPLVHLWQEMLEAMSRFISPADFRG